VIEFKNVSKHFGPTQVLHNIDLNIKQGEVVVIIGPSGSGKSTLLRCINKLEEITSGDLIVDGLKVNDPKVDERLIRQEAGMVFQQFYLFPHLTALENVMFGPLRVRGADKAAAEALAKDLLAKVGLAERSHHYPSELSGGQQQRVAIARALAVKPKMMLFDEPTSALDPELRHPRGAEGHAGSGGRRDDDGDRDPRNRLCRESGLPPDLHRQRPYRGRWQPARADRQPAEPALAGVPPARVLIPQRVKTGPAKAARFFYARLFPNIPRASPHSILIILLDIFTGGRRAVDPVAVA